MHVEIGEDSFAVETDQLPRESAREGSGVSGVNGIGSARKPPWIKAIKVVKNPGHDADKANVRDITSDRKAK